MTDPKNMEVEFDSKQLDFAEKSEKFGHLVLVVDGIGLNPIPTGTHTRVQVSISARAYRRLIFIWTLLFNPKNCKFPTPSPEISKYWVAVFHYRNLEA